MPEVSTMSMVEIVARAICAADVLAPDPDAPILIGHRTAKAWEGRVEMARAALSALTTPTEGMVEAGSVYTQGEYAPGQAARDCWAAMLQAALNEGKA